MSYLTGTKNHGLLPLLGYPEGSQHALYINTGLDSLFLVDFEQQNFTFESSVEGFFDYWGIVDNRLLMQESVDSGLVYHRSRQLDLSHFERRSIPDVIELDGARFICNFNSRVQKIKGVDSTYVIVPLSSTDHSYWESSYFSSTCLALLDWQTNKVKTLDVSYPNIYRQQCNGGFLTTFPAVNKSSIIVAYPASTELCVYDLKTHKSRFIDRPPVNFEFKVNPYDTTYKDDMNFLINYMMTETQVVGFEYHSQLNCYLRFFDHHKAGDSGLNELQGRCFLQLLSHEFDVIGEYRLPSGVVPIHHHMCQNGFRISFPDSLSRAKKVSRYAEFDLRPLLQ